ncbi:hypothetical protein QLQ12_18320 [Actinoplanes sp. NEAU-A12]|uniref:Uncharacterized protein n=1 Tax=Actinoplanes sandaracinus TaxID=3045177 RepID=A0ABT6WLG7_9ACTN|nr:hypothetical protein [Actinoplanes sandaracinus]MDI6100569.1 hypothetical protein [Actinoplanes sandaracinus]
MRDTKASDTCPRLSYGYAASAKRARYEAERAERAFTLVDPGNHLVARTLEVRWEPKLATLTEAEAPPDGPVRRYGPRYPPKPR